MDAELKAGIGGTLFIAAYMLLVKDHLYLISGLNVSLISDIILIGLPFYVVLYFCFKELDKKNVALMYGKSLWASVICSFIIASISFLKENHGPENMAGLAFVFLPPIFITMHLIMISAIALFYKIIGRLDKKK
jgi:hypothetical protein